MFFQDNNNNNDKELIDMCLAGNEQGFELLYKKFKVNVMNICFKVMKNHATAEELSQETFLQCFRHLKDFKLESTLGRWIYKIAMNACKQYMRLRKNNSEFTTDDLSLNRLIDKDHFNNLSRLEIDQLMIQQAIEKLPPGQKKIFIMFDIEGYTHEEISPLLEISPGTSKSQLSKARQKLKLEL